jgi:hypothetical protein
MKVHPFSALNAIAPQYSHTYHGTPVNKISVPLDTFLLEKLVDVTSDLHSY